MKVKTNYANTPAWREVNVKSRIPEPLKMLEYSGTFEDVGKDGPQHLVGLE